MSAYAGRLIPHSGILPNLTRPLPKGSKPDVALTEKVIAPPTEQPPINHAAIVLLHSWAEEGDEQEQRETWEYLKKALDKDRLSGRKLFP